MEIQVTVEKPKVIGRVKGRFLKLDEEPIAYGLYRGRLGVETPSGVYILVNCVDTLEVQVDGKVIVLDFRPFTWACRG